MSGENSKSYTFDSLREKIREACAEKEREKMLKACREVMEIIDALENVHHESTSAFKLSIEALDNEVRKKSEAEKELKKHKLELEDIVNERTSEFIKINERLLREARERKYAEDALREQSQRYLTLFNNVNDAVFIQKMNGSGVFSGKLIEVNDVACKLTGYPRGELLKFTPEIFYDPESIAVEEDSIKEKISEGNTVLCEMTMVSSSGISIPVEVHMHCFEMGGDHMLMSLVRDISERKLKEETLKFHEQLMRTALDASSDGVWDRNLTSGSMYFGENWSRTLGYEDDELSHSIETFLKLIHPDDLNSYKKAMEDYLSGRNEVYSAQFRLMDKHGNWRWLLSRGKILEWDEGGKPIRIAGTHTDITEKKKAEEALRESEERYRYLIEHAPVPIMVHCAGIIEFINEAGTKLLGAGKPEDVTGMKITDFCNFPGKLPPGFMEKRITEKGNSIPLSEEKILTLTGKAIDIETCSTPCVFNGKRAIQTIGIEITGRKNSETLNRIQHEVTVGLSEPGDLSEISNRLIEAGLRIEGIDCGGVYFFDGATRKLDLVSHSGFSNSFVANFSRYDADTREVNLIMAGKAVYQDKEELLAQSGTIQKMEQLTALAYIPVSFGGKIIAVLTFGSHTHKEIPVFSRSLLEAIAVDIGGVISRARIEEALRQSEEQYRTLIETIPHGVQETDIYGNILFANEARDRIFGFYPGESVGRNVSEHFVLENKHDYTAFLENLAREEPEPRTYYGEALTKNNGKKTFLRCDWDYKRNKKGEIEGFISIISDITAEKEASEKLRKKVRYEECLGACSGILLYENNSPSAIIGVLELLQRTAKVSRAYVFSNFKDADGALCARLTMEAYAEDADSRMENTVLKNIMYDAGYEEWRDDFVNGNSISGSLSDCSGKEKRLLYELRVKSIMAMPLFVNSQWYGFIGFGDVDQGRSWKEELRLLQTASEMVGSCLARRMAEEQLLKTSQRYQRLFNGVNDAILIRRLSGDEGEAGFMEVNDVACSMTGYSREELFSMSPADLEDSEYVSDMLPGVNERLEVYGEALYEMVLVTKNGRRLPVENHARHFSLGDERIALYVLRDISERRKFDDLKIQFEFQQKLIDAIPVPIYYKDKKGRYLGCNNAMLELNGFNTKYDFIGRTVDDFWLDINPSFAEIIREDEYILTTKGGAISREFDSINSAYRSSDFMIHKTVIHNAEGRPEFIVGVIIDLTDLKQTQSRLIEAEQKLNTILNTIRETIIRLDGDMRILWANKAAYDTFGKNEKDIIGKHCYEIWLRNEPCEGCPVAKSKDSGVMESGKIHVKNDEHTYEVNAYPVTAPDGSSAGYVEVAMDVTEKEKVQKQLLQADKMASLGTLVSGVAHEINNPTNFIMINISILRKMFMNMLPVIREYKEDYGNFVIAGIPVEKLDSSIIDLFMGIEEGTERISKIVSSLKDYAKESPRELEDVKVNEVFKSALVLLDNLIKRKTNNFSVECSSRLPRIKGDFRKIEQVLVNIIQNACDALENKTQAIRIKTSHDRKNNLVVITVKDEGKGIPENDLKYIRDPFFTTKRDLGGTGLGLSISTRIIEEHDGKLEIDSTEGKGTEVKITLPVFSETQDTKRSE